MDALETRSTEQRRAALLRGNVIRSYRAQKKKDVKAGIEPAGFFLVNGPHDPLLRSMKVRDALMAMPTVRAKKADTILRVAGVSPVKSLGGMTPGQWNRLYAVLDTYPALRQRLSDARATIQACG